MKRPYYDEFERRLIHMDTFLGAHMRLRLEFLKVAREMNKELVPLLAPIIHGLGLQFKRKYRRYLP